MTMTITRKLTNLTLIPKTQPAIDYIYGYRLVVANIGSTKISSNWVTLTVSAPPMLIPHLWTGQLPDGTMKGTFRRIQLYAESSGTPDVWWASVDSAFL